MHSAAASAPQSSTSERRPPGIVEGVASPTNLTGLGIKVSEYLTEWEGNGNQSVICFGSLTVLLQYAEEVQTTFKFLHTLIGRVYAAQARACYKITPPGPRRPNRRNPVQPLRRSYRLTASRTFLRFGRRRFRNGRRNRPVRRLSAIVL
jgi:hypothetical protein